MLDAPVTIFAITAVVSCFNVQFRNLSGGTNENRDITEQSMSRPRMEPNPSEHDTET
jgi:hypothetical protein